jgi:hypothetical protein
VPSRRRHRPSVGMATLVRWQHEQLAALGQRDRSSARRCQSRHARRGTRAVSRARPSGHAVASWRRRPLTSSLPRGSARPARQSMMCVVRCAICGLVAQLNQTTASDTRHDTVTDRTSHSDCPTTTQRHPAHRALRNVHLLPLDNALAGAPHGGSGIRGVWNPGMFRHVEAVYRAKVRFDNCLLCRQIRGEPLSGHRSLCSGTLGHFEVRDHERP